MRMLSALREADSKLLRPAPQAARHKPARHKPARHLHLHLEFIAPTLLLATPPLLTLRLAPPPQPAAGPLAAAGPRLTLVRVLKALDQVEPRDQVALDQV